MRLWSLHPRYLDSRGLVALWREALLAQAVLAGKTRGYLHHPQLDRFRKSPLPQASIASYLEAVLVEATRRDYSFDAAKIQPGRATTKLVVTRGQLAYEWRHLVAKLGVREPSRLEEYAEVALPEPHPLFRVVAGPVAPWENTRDYFADGGNA